MPSGRSLADPPGNHHVARSADDPDLRSGTRSFLLTGRTLDASTMLGYVGQLGWTQTVDGKASSFRDTAEPVLYLHPAESCSGQLVLILRTLKINVVYPMPRSDYGLSSHGGLRFP